MPCEHVPGAQGPGLAPCQTSARQGRNGHLTSTLCAPTVCSVPDMLLLLDGVSWPWPFHREAACLDLDKTTSGSKQVFTRSGPVLLTCRHLRGLLARAHGQHVSSLGFLWAQTQGRPRDRMALTSGLPGCQGAPNPMRHIEQLRDDKFSSKIQKGNVTDSYRCARAEEAGHTSR